MSIFSLISFLFPKQHCPQQAVIPVRRRIPEHSIAFIEEVGALLDSNPLLKSGSTPYEQGPLTIVRTMEKHALSMEQVFDIAYPQRRENLKKDQASIQRILDGLGLLSSRGILSLPQINVCWGGGWIDYSESRVGWEILRGALSDVLPFPKFLATNSVAQEVFFKNVKCEIQFSYYLSGYDMEEKTVSRATVTPDFFEFSNQGAATYLVAERLQWVLEDICWLLSCHP